MLSQPRVSEWCQIWFDRSSHVSIRVKVYGLNVPLQSCIKVFAFLNSFKPSGGECHIPHDSQATRDTLVHVNGVKNSGFTSYFMEYRDIPTFNTTVSKTGSIYWRTAANDLDDNADLYGFESASDCFKACHLITDGNCWLFKYVFFRRFLRFSPSPSHQPLWLCGLFYSFYYIRCSFDSSNERCVVPTYIDEPLTSTALDNFFVPQVVDTSSVYMFKPDVVASGKFEWISRYENILFYTYKHTADYHVLLLCCS